MHRIARLGEVWGEIRYRHPWLAYRDLDWDAGLLRALPLADAARDSAAYAEAVRVMLAVLGDSLTRVIGDEPEGPLIPPNPRPLLSEERGIVILNLAAASIDSALDAESSAIAARAANASAAVVDLRGSPGTWTSSQSLDRAIRSVAPLLFSGELKPPGSRYVTHDGYRSQDAGDPTGGGYTSGFESVAQPALQGAGGPGPARVVVLLDEMAPLHPVLLALRQRGIAALVAEGNVDHSWTITTEWLDAGEGVTAQVRLAEMEADLGLDAQYPARSKAGGIDLAFRGALELARRPGRRREPGHAGAALPSPVWRPDKTYAESAYPDRALRQLAAIRLWNVIRLFYPYHALMDDAWEGSLEPFLPRFEAARDAREYALAVLEMAVLVKDGHTIVGGVEPTRLMGGRIPLALDVLEIEGKPVVVDVPATLAASGVEPGDIVTDVDGKSIEVRLRELEPLVTASTPRALRYNLIRWALSGADSVASLRLRGAKGSKEATLVRTLDAYQKARRALLQEAQGERGLRLDEAPSARGGRRDVPAPRRYPSDHLRPARLSQHRRLADGSVPEYARRRGRGALRIPASRSVGMAAAEI